MLKPLEAKIVKATQGNLPLTRRPFADIAAAIDCREEEVLHTITDLMERGLIRKFCAVLRHQQAGWEQNALAIWSAPEGLCEKAGLTLATFPEVTHCYERTPPFLGKYNLFTMVHLKNHQRENFFRKLSEATGIDDFLVLASVEEFKKTSMEFFNDQ